MSRAPGFTGFPVQLFEHHKMQKKRKSQLVCQQIHDFFFFGRNLKMMQHVTLKVTNICRESNGPRHLIDAQRGR